jgi:hypothetical protein
MGVDQPLFSGLIIFLMPKMVSNPNVLFYKLKKCIQLEYVQFKAYGQIRLDSFRSDSLFLHFLPPLVLFVCIYIAAFAKALCIVRHILMFTVGSLP